MPWHLAPHSGMDTALAPHSGMDTARRPPPAGLTSSALHRLALRSREPKGNGPHLCSASRSVPCSGKSYVERAPRVPRRSGCVNRSVGRDRWGWRDRREGRGGPRGTAGDYGDRRGWRDRREGRRGGPLGLEGPPGGRTRDRGVAGGTAGQVEPRGVYGMSSSKHG
jgi:hypothetical protein